MKLFTTTIALTLTTASKAAFLPQSSSYSFQQPSTTTTKTTTTTTAINGYLDDLSNELYKPEDMADEVADSREMNQMDKSQIDRYGPGNLNGFVDFQEFDGGDGQMGVAGDGQQGLDKKEFETGALASQMNNSRARSAKNAWGTSTGYADQLLSTNQNMDAVRAQQLENWHQQREIQAKKQQQKYITEQFDNQQQSAEADWRTLAKFGVERNQEFDLNEAFGEVSIEGGQLEGTIEINTRVGGTGYHEFMFKNPFMGFADFRTSLTPESGASWTVTPKEGSLSKEPTQFSVRFTPGSMGISEGHLIIETEDFKKVWKLVGST